MMPPSNQSTLLMCISVLQPSQLYISRDKLKAVESRIDFTDPANIPPIPIKRLDGLLMMTDGHTRAFAAYRAGWAEVPIIYDLDALDWEAYRICVRWCWDAGIKKISDLECRVVTPRDYKSLWLDRCQCMQDELAEKRKQ